nr:amidohydrolase family protein [Melioribacteraceae bacterium]
MNKVVLKNGCFLQEINFCLVPFLGSIVINNNIIEEYYADNDYSDYEIINLAGRVVTKPFCNFHEHIYSKLAKGFNINSPMDSFEKILADYWWKEDLCLTEESIYYSSLLTGIDALKNGVGYIFDHHSSPNFIKGSLKIIAESLNSLNISNILSYEITDRNGQIKTQDAIVENFDFLSNSYPLSKGMIGLHASFTVSDNTLKNIADLNNQLNAGIHLHICEGEEDRLLSISKYKKTPLDRFLYYNLLNTKSILAHGVKLNFEELSELSRLSIPLAINVDSNLNNSVGFHNYHSILNNNILLGTDGMHSNILKSIKNTFLIARLSGLSFEKAFCFIKGIYKTGQLFLKEYFNSTS